MPRPCKQRRVCAMPGCLRFGPVEGGKPELPPIAMAVDEFEAIRLIDYEGLTQEACAARMNVARTTAQAIYAGARSKVAECLVTGRELTIQGGAYVLCDGAAIGCGHVCARRRCEALEEQNEGENPRNGRRKNMRIAVTYENGTVFQHFGHAEQFKLYDVESGAVRASKVVETNGSGHGALAAFLKGNGVDVLICGGIGAGAQNALREAGVQLYGGVTGSADEAVSALLNGTLAYNAAVQCSHHDERHGADHTCGEHGCGGHAEGHACGGHTCGGK